MEKINLDTINLAYRRLRESVKAINAVVEEGRTWWDDYNPLYDMEIRDSKLHELKTSLELFLASNYSNMSPGVNLFAGVNYHEWFTVETFEAGAFVKKLHEAVGGKADEIALKENIHSSCHIFRYGSWNAKSKQSAPDEAVRQFVKDNTITGSIWIDRTYASGHTDSRGRFKKGRELHRESLNAINSFLWLAHFLWQPKPGAASPSAFRCQLALDSWQCPNIEIPFTRDFVYGPITKLHIYANGSVKFTFKKPEQAARVVRVLFGERVDLIYRKTELDPEAIFQKNEYVPQRVVRVCKEAAA